MNKAGSLLHNLVKGYEDEVANTSQQGQLEQSYVPQPLGLGAQLKEMKVL